MIKQGNDTVIRNHFSEDEQMRMNSRYIVMFNWMTQGFTAVEDKGQRGTESNAFWD